MGRSGLLILYGCHWKSNELLIQYLASTLTCRLPEAFLSAMLVSSQNNNCLIFIWCPHSPCPACAAAARSRCYTRSSAARTPPPGARSSAPRLVAGSGPGTGVGPRLQPCRRGLVRLRSIWKTILMVNIFIRRAAVSISVKNPIFIRISSSYTNGCKSTI